MPKPYFPATNLLTTAQAAEALGVSLRTIQLWCESGKLNAKRTPGGHRRIPVAAVAAIRHSMGASSTTVVDDLLGALRALLDAGELGRVTAEIIAQARAAIARAEGVAA